MYFYLAMVGFEPTPTSTAAPSNTETTVIYIYIHECRLKVIMALLYYDNLIDIFFESNMLTFSNQNVCMCSFLANGSLCLYGC